MVEKIINAVLLLGSFTGVLITSFKWWAAYLKKKEQDVKIKKLEEENEELKKIIGNLKR